MNRYLLVLPVLASLGVASEWPSATIVQVAAENSSGAVGVEVLRAYIDPGVAGFVIVSVLGFISSIGYMTRSYLGRVKRRLFGSGEARADGNADEEAANC